MTAVVTKLSEAYKKSKFWQSKRPEFSVIVLYFVLFCVISFFHEPWFDEAQSWQIAKCESIGRLLFYIPHYEGNPPLWYLILTIPAKLGLPFEIGLKSVGVIICLCSVSLLELKSPFPRAVKLVLPFTYFFFYQYGIIVRPYGLMILAFILVALSFKSRNERPLRFVLSLAFLCETSSFCVVVAGGIAACWLLEILQEGFLTRKWLRDRRLYALLGLFIFALILSGTILPPDDASFTSYLEGENPFLKRFFVAITTTLSDTLLVTSPWFAYETMTLAASNIPLASLITGILAQIIIVAHVFCFSNRKNLKYFVVPYFCFCLFGAAVVLAGHYLGVGYCIFIFWLWISCADDRQFEMGNKLADLLHFGTKDKSLLKKFALAFCTFSIMMSLLWTISSSIKEIEYQYSYGRETVHFLEETGLINAKIANAWDEEKTESGDIDYKESDTKSNGWAVPLCAHAGRNIVYNFNDGADDAAYVQFIRQTAEQNRNTIERWGKQGAPDVLLGEVDVKLLTNNAVTLRDYSPVYEMEFNYIWKGNLLKKMQYLFLRNDLLIQYSLTPIDRPEGMVGSMGFVISDEMKERYENGEAIEDILKPYMDYIFGEEDKNGK